VPSSGKADHTVRRNEGARLGRILLAAIFLAILVCVVWWPIYSECRESGKSVMNCILGAP